MNYIMLALGFVLDLFYRILGNYGFAIILFTIFIKLLLFPLDLKQRKSMAKTQKIQPLLMEVQKKYANDKDKLNQETLKLYQKYGISPTSGCLPMLIQLPIIFALYWVVRKPIFYMMGVDKAEIWRIAEAFNAWAAVNADALPEALRNVVPVTYQQGMGNANTFGSYEIQISQLLFKHPEILNHPAITSWDNVLKPIDFSFFGMDLSEVPNLNAFLGIFIGRISNITSSVALLWIIPVLAGFSSWLTTKVTSPAKQDKPKKGVVLSEDEKAQSKSNPTADTMRSMTMIMPLFSAWFAFTLPAAVGLYWIVSNAIQMLNHFLVTKYMTDDISPEELEGEINNVKKSRKNRKKRK
ncbi:MAG: YidC/Oxa1 family membrane protein insertase [Clostridia bacterium]|nr:YidC/Oxa1 family membrane protein insertase [Clostridia bacterium]